MLLCICPVSIERVLSLGGAIAIAASQTTCACSLINLTAAARARSAYYRGIRKKNLRACAQMFDLQSSRLVSTRIFVTDLSNRAHTPFRLISRIWPVYIRASHRYTRITTCLLYCSCTYYCFHSNHLCEHPTHTHSHVDHSPTAANKRIDDPHSRENERAHRREHLCASRVARFKCPHIQV